MAITVQAAGANESTPESSEDKVKTVEVVRGKPITIDDLGAIADLSTARDQKGNPVTLDFDTYEIGSFSKTTITIVPPNGKPEDVITLDINKRPS